MQDSGNYGLTVWGGYGTLAPNYLYLKLPAYAGPLSARGELKSLFISLILPEITNSYTIKLPAYAGPLSARGELKSLFISLILPEITNSYRDEVTFYPDKPIPEHN